jgi:hypothetical protein
MNLHHVQHDTLVVSLQSSGPRPLRGPLKGHAWGMPVGG